MSIGVIGSLVRSYFGNGSGTSIGGPRPEGPR